MWPEGEGRDAHSLHYVLPWAGGFPPELAAWCIERYSKRGEVVLDPFCGSGTTALEAVLAGRVACAVDANPLATRVTAAKIRPADISEVTLALQNVNFRRPIDLKLHSGVFAPFYDIDTFRELMNLRTVVGERGDRIFRFIELVALSLLHGHSAGYFSVYSFPQISLPPEEQELLNVKRRQVPDYRAVVPRVLRKAASVLRDGWASSIRGLEGRHRVETADARDLGFLRNSSVDLVVSGPPLPGDPDPVQDQWLRLWFAGVKAAGVRDQLFRCSEVGEWLEFMNSALFELARVVRPRGRAVLDLRSISIDRREILLDDELSAMVQEQLGAYWDIEGVFVNREKPSRLGTCVREREPGKSPERSRMVVLRRR